MLVEKRGQSPGCAPGYINMQYLGPAQRYMFQTCLCRILKLALKLPKPRGGDNPHPRCRRNVEVSHSANRIFARLHSWNRVVPCIPKNWSYSWHMNC